MQRNALTLLDVAAAAGVSRSTVSRVINDHPAVAPDVRERVKRVIDALGYHPDGAARALASGRHGADEVDLVIVEEDASAFGTNPFYSRVVAGVLEALAGTDARMRVHLVPEAQAPRLLDEVAHRAALGTLLVNVPAALGEAFYRHNPKMVSLGRSAAHVPFTEPENVAGAKLAVQHLLERGRRRIAAIDGRLTNPCAADRRRGYTEAMHESGLRPVSAKGEYRREGGRRATHRLLAFDPAIDAIFAACDLSATGALQALAEMGRRVPEDVAVVGFDGSVLAECTTPPLTSVCQPVEEMAATVTRDLLADDVTRDWQRGFPTTLAVRTSTAA